MYSSASGVGSWERIGLKSLLGWIIIAGVLFAVLRLPEVVHKAGQMDEQFFAVPGLTVLKEGIPRIPYSPIRRRATYFENADVCLFTLPPALHYVQAPFFAVMKAGYAPARMPSFLAGFAAIVCIAVLARPRINRTWVIGLLLVMFAVSRPVMFTSTIARPDLLCAVCGWCAMIALERSLKDDRHRWIALAGGLCGLGLLFHPYAMIFCIQCAVWALCMKGQWKQRIGRIVLLAICAAAVLSLWLPLIAAHSYEFKSQFFSNVMERSGSGIVPRMLWPWVYLEKHYQLSKSLNEPCQFWFLCAGLTAGTVLWLSKNRDACHVRYLALAWSACYLTATVVGIHPTRAYCIYPVGLIYPVAVDAAVRITCGLSEGVSRFLKVPIVGRFLGQSAIVALLIALMIPGSGIRSSIVYLSHWGDTRFHAQKFVESILADMPTEGVYMADASYVFDVYLSGRRTLMCDHKQHFWGDEKVDIDYMFIDHEGNFFGYAPDYPELHFEKHFGGGELFQECTLDLYASCKHKEELSKTAGGCRSVVNQRASLP